jgi:hypothetical protein
MSIRISQLVIPLSSTILAAIANTSTSTTHMTTNYREHIPLIHHKLKNSILLNPLFLDLNANAHISIMPCMGERFDCKK